MKQLGPARTHRLPGQAYFLTYGGGYVWAVGEGGKVWRVDPSSGAVTATVDVGRTLGIAWPAFGHGSVWVASLADGVLLRIDPASGKVRARVPLGEVVSTDRPMTIGFSGDAVWVTNQTANTLSRVDPNTNRLIRTISLSGDAARPPDPAPSAVVVLGDVLWLSEHHSDSLARMPLSGEQIVSTCHGSPGGGRLAASRDALWLADTGGVVSRIDTATAKVTDRLLLPGPTAGEIVGGGDEVWTAAGSHVFRLDPNTNTVDAAAALPEVGDGGSPERFPGGLAIAVAPESVWTTDLARNRLVSFPR